MGALRSLLMLASGCNRQCQRVWALHSSLSTKLVSPHSSSMLWWVQMWPHNTYTQFLNHKTCVFPTVHIKMQTWSQWEQPCIRSVSSVCHASSSCLWLVLVSRAWVWTSWDRLIKQRSRETESVSESAPGLRGYSVTLTSVWWNAGTK